MACAADVQVGRVAVNQPLRTGKQTWPEPEAIPKNPLGVAGSPGNRSTPQGVEIGVLRTKQLCRLLGICPAWPWHLR